MCDICGGVGMVRVPADNPVGVKYVLCTCRKEEMRKKRAKRLREKSGVTFDLTRYSFDRFYPNKAKGDARARKALAEYKANLQAYSENPEGWRLLVGPPGSGKTHLAYAVVKARIDLDKPVYYASVPELLDALKAGFDDAWAYEERLRTMCEVQLLVLDDLGVENPTLWAKEKVFQLVNYRYTRRLPLVVTTNVTELEPRLASRLKDHELSDVLVFQVGDYR